MFDTPFFFLRAESPTTHSQGNTQARIHCLFSFQKDKWQQIESVSKQIHPFSFCGLKAQLHTALVTLRQKYIVFSPFQKDKWQQIEGVSCLIHPFSFCRLKALLHIAQGITLGKNSPVNLCAL